ncbi:hypothetical protein [Novosphingobium sp. AP12]|uniref:hypothetical protein n=1 Tax=Novosphingobium sp. AP12 TaxID=1144305 RepID=UPI0002721540|nr:hypothetical protein [Novosphingobium sp. AP12]EJL22438.1 hypothetical protein PMI02_04670 [Novosphingobium sp. AP12]
MTGAQVIRVPAYRAETTERQRRWSRICAVAGVGAIILGIASCTWANWAERASTQSEAVQHVAPAAPVDLKAKIAPDAVEIMKRSDYSKTYAKLGKAQFANANELAPWAAMAAAADDACPKVNLVGISDTATRAKLVWYVDCDGGKRMMIDQESAEAARTQHDAEGGA